MIEDYLKQLGFSEYDIKIYLTLVNAGASLAGSIADFANVNRRNVYDALNRLIRKGFVSIILKNNKKYYLPAPPEKIISMYEERLDNLKDLLPELSKQFNLSKSKREVCFFEGKNGIKTIFETMFQSNKEIFVIGATGLAMEYMPLFITKLFKHKGSKFKIKQLWNHDAKNVNKYKELLHSEDKFLPNNFKTNSQLFVYGDRTIILIWSSIPFAILIIDQDVSNGFKSYFDFLWSISK